MLVFDTAINIAAYSGVEMKELYSGLTVHLLGYPIALAIMVAFYASEVLSITVRTTTRWLVPARSKALRK
jgi:hypothetical protein